MIGCRPLESDEIQETLSAMARAATAARDQALFVLGITTGFRISEILSLKVRDVTQDGKLNGHVRIVASRMKGKRRPRSAVLAPTARPYLESWIRELRLQNRGKGNDWLFPSRQGEKNITRVQAHRILKTAFERAGIEGADRELATHSMRKTYAARMYEAHGQNIWKVQNALGHASPASTVRYLSFEDQEQRDAVESAFGEL